MGIGPHRDRLLSNASGHILEVGIGTGRIVTIPDADHGYGFYSNQPEVDAALHDALVSFFRKALR